MTATVLSRNTRAPERLPSILVLSVRHRRLAWSRKRSNCRPVRWESTFHTQADYSPVQSTQGYRIVALTIRPTRETSTNRPSPSARHPPTRARRPRELSPAPRNKDRKLSPGDWGFVVHKTPRCEPQPVQLQASQPLPSRTCTSAVTQPQPLSNMMFRTI